MEALTIDGEVARSIRLQGILTSKNYEETSHQALQCHLNGIEIADITHTFPKKHETGEVYDIKSILHPAYFLDFNAYKKAVTAMAWRNRIRRHTPDGQGKITLLKLMEQHLTKELEGETEELSFSFSPWKTLTDPAVNDDLQRYASPWALVAAGTRFGIQVSDGEKAFKSILHSLMDLKSGFRISHEFEKPKAYFLGDVFEMYYTDDNRIMIEGKDERPTKRLKNNTYYEPLAVWKGPASDFAQFIFLMERAIGKINGTPCCKYLINGAVNPGLSVFFYVNHDCSSISDVDTPGVDSWVKEVPFRPIGMIYQTSNTRVYAGDKVPLETRIITE